MCSLIGKKLILETKQVVPSMAGNKADIEK